MIEEDRRNSNAGYVQHLKKKEDEQWKQKKEQELEFKGIKNNKDLDKPAYKHKEEKIIDKEVSEAGKIQPCERGLSILDMWYRAYDRRTKTLPFYKEVYERQKELGDDVSYPT